MCTHQYAVYSYENQPEYVKKNSTTILSEVLKALMDARKASPPKRKKNPPIAGTEKKES